MKNRSSNEAYKRFKERVFRYSETNRSSLRINEIQNYKNRSVSCDIKRIITFDFRLIKSPISNFNYTVVNEGAKYDSLFNKYQK